MSDLDEIRGKLVYAQERLDAANEAMRVADMKDDAAFAMGGGIPGFGGSGNQRAAQQVRSALGSAHRAWQDASQRIEKWSYRVKRLEARIAEIERPRLTREDVRGATLVHDGISWRKVVRVNAKSVSVESGYSWVDRIDFDRIRDYRPRHSADQGR